MSEVIRALLNVPEDCQDTAFGILLENEDIDLAFEVPEGPLAPPEESKQHPMYHLDWPEMASIAINFISTAGGIAGLAASIMQIQQQMKENQKSKNVVELVVGDQTLKISGEDNGALVGLITALVATPNDAGPVLPPPASESPQTTPPPGLPAAQPDTDTGDCEQS